MKITNLIFWQNIISIHQIDIFHELAKNFKVFLFVQEEQDKYRKNENWDIPETDFMICKVIRGKEHIKSLLFQFYSDTSVHIFSGIASYSLLHYAFKQAITNGLYVGIMSETLNPLGLKGIIRSLRTYIFRIRFDNKIKFILAIGGNGYKWFMDHGFSADKIYMWGYFLKRNTKEFIKRNFNRCKVILIGRLIKLKGILEFLTIAEECSNEFEDLCIIGKGPLKKRILKIISTSNRLKEKVKLIDYLPNSSIIEKIAEYDLLVLPSIYTEGWGVVINEALMAGIPAIASRMCGASILLDGLNRGEDFNPMDRKNYKKVFKKWCSDSLTVNRQEIRHWSEKINAEINARYFEQILIYTFEHHNSKPNPPWIN